MVFDPRGEPVVSRAFRKPIDDGVVTSLTRELRVAGPRRPAPRFVPNDPALGDGAIALPIATGGAPAPTAPRRPGWWRRRTGAA